MGQDVAVHWRRLEALAQEHRNRDPAGYANDLSQALRVGGLTLDWTLQRIDKTVLRALCEFLNAMQAQKRLQQQFAGEKVNTTANQGALHSAMRGTLTASKPFNEEVLEGQQSVMQFAEDVLVGSRCSYCGKPFTDVLHIGIGGSHLGQSFLTDAFSSTRLKIHYLSNSLPNQIENTLAALDPRNTLVIVASKSFSTPETLHNYRRVQTWFAENTSDQGAIACNVVLITSNHERVVHEPGEHFLIPKEVGGRFSIWSAMGLPALLAMGPKRYRALCEGAFDMDTHVMQGEPSQNAAIMLALLEVWNTNFLRVANRAVLPYCSELRQLPAYLQQLEMESLGKTPQPGNGLPPHHTIPLVWGGEETNAQHAFHQWLHQGTHAFVVDFIALANANRWHLANCLAQREALFYGHLNDDAPQKSLRGGHGSTLILLDSCDAKTVGSLIALYEHKTALLGYLWEVNPFDQEGVEYGKVSATAIYERLELAK